MKLFLSPRLWLGIAISLFCLWLAMRDVPFSELAEALGSANYVWLLPVIVLQVLATAARARRWVVLLDKEEHMADSFWAQAIGFLFTNILPFRAGEPARALVMAERCKVPVVQVAASVVVERLLDVVAVLAILVMVLPWMRVPSMVLQAGQIFGATILLMVIVLVLLVKFSSFAEGLLQYVCDGVGFLPGEKIITGWRQLICGLAPLTRWRVAVRSVVWSAVVWGLTVVLYWFILRAFESSASFTEAAFLQVALAFAITVPSSPGFIGVFQLAGQQALVLPFGAKYDAALALAIILTAHLLYYLFTSALGLIGLWKVGESFSNLGRGIVMRQQRGG